MGTSEVGAGKAVLDPEDLRYVGPATSAVIDEAQFDAADIQERRVSHRTLVEAGVNEGVAELLRREYRLLWDFRWHPGGEYLPRRAANLSGADEAERHWIADSADDWDGRLPEVKVNGSRPSTDEERSRIRDDWPEWPEFDELEVERDLDEALGTDKSASDCPRCGGRLSRFEMGEQAAIQCDACGYVGVALSVQQDAWRQAVDRLVKGRHRADSG